MNFPSEDMMQLEALWMTHEENPDARLREACKEWKISVKHVKQMARTHPEWQEVVDLFDKERKYTPIRVEVIDLS